MNRRKKRPAETKILLLPELKRISANLRRAGRRIVFTNGCFDILHWGHVKYLQDASRLGDILMVAINSDSSIRRLKGNKRPIINQLDRARTLAALESVDYVTVFNQDTPIKVIETVKPYVLVKGSDWKKNKIVGGGFVLGYGGRVSTLNFVKGHSTTSLINKIAKAF